MGRPRVLSFMSEWGGGSPHRRSPSQAGPSAPQSPSTKQPTFAPASSSTTALDNLERPSPGPTPQQGGSESRPSSRPMSMIQTYQPPIMEVGQDTLPELQRIFTFLNSHSNKLYQEGYFLKFHDTDTHGRPAKDRVWQECFAQLVGTILSLWDASELDQAGGDAEVLPTFINLTDAALVMMPSMTLSDGKTLDNILSVSTAASNKYLFHFNSFNSLTQWTAGIRLAMYEHTTLQEAYTGALIAGKGKTLNNIRMILDRQRAKHEDWARVRFGAGTPWRRCWCVVTPPNEKEYAKLQKAQKKSNIYNRSTPVLKGDIKFYDTKKITKKTRPIATVKDAYSAYAIYPQSKPLIDQSTLMKIEGNITIHSNPESVTEGFVFVMPETHPAVSGFEIMLRFMFPVFDTFALYGRPSKLIADVLDTRGLMFAMPPDRRYGYLEMWDVVGLIQTEGSQSWSERQWRKELKNLTSKRMATTPSRNQSRTGSRRNTVSRVSLPGAGGVRFDDRSSIQSQPTSRHQSPVRHADFEPAGPRRVDSAPPEASFGSPRHRRSVSETNGYKQYQSETPSRLAYGVSADNETDTPPPPPPPPPPEHRTLYGNTVSQSPVDYEPSDGEEQPTPSPRSLPDLHAGLAAAPPQGPVDTPPSFSHSPGQRPKSSLYQPPSTMKPSAQIDPATLHQMADATHAPLPAGIAVAGAAAAWRSQDSSNGRRSGEYDRRLQERDANARGYSADQYYQRAPPTRSGQSGSRLPTIPASPYIEQPEFVEQHNAYQPMAPSVPEHMELPPQSSSSAELAVHRWSGSSQLHRKAVPGRSLQDDNLSIANSSLGSLRNEIIDPDALDRLTLEESLVRNNSLSSSRYDDDGASTSTPDYASSVNEEVKVRKVPSRRGDRPRSGVLKFVGNPDLNPKPEVVVGDTHYKPNAKKTPDISSDIPVIDFGPTYSLDPKRPGTSGTMTQDLHDSSIVSPKAKQPSPNDAKQRHSYFVASSSPNVPTHGRSASASPFSDTRNVAWQPGMAAHHTNHTRDKSRLDPEEWVQQRAAAAAQPRGSPVYAHARSKSHTPPPLSRNHSGDWTHLQRTPEGLPARSPNRTPERPPSRPLSRPLSRGAGNLLNEKPTNLSAREQEQVARMTGTPFLDLMGSGKDKDKRPSTAGGLVGYVENREQERAAAKANRHTAAMQAEIERRMVDARQRQMVEMQQQMQMARAQSLYAAAPSVYGAPSVMGTVSGFPTTPQQVPVQAQLAVPGLAYSPSSSQMFQQQQQLGYFAGATGMSPGMAVGWGTPSPQQQMQGAFGQEGQQYQSSSPQIQPYGASFDQAKAAARFAHLERQGRR
ncbi:hypothetical protein GQ43DRAFT_436066 [Delitschia confertaspora ATCC 74209]|uniref:PH domain-containing protein n=1 Tax=Delitschia confertaspora ATCC 74209 TaxID=1513339 RepID=A0A9P4JEI2_9PLEO|nr:hypothetical protein GQ43DRAFT_436066 [Delitschia confertaspora ATCC 74209]